MIIKEKHKDVMNVVILIKVLQRFSRDSCVYFAVVYFFAYFGFCSTKTYDDLYL